MRVTLYTDASFKDGAGGWAIWARSDAGTIVESGKCPIYVIDSNGSELSAIFAGAYIVSVRWPATSRILVRTDSQMARDWLSRKLWRNYTYGGDAPKVRSYVRLCRKIVDLKIAIDVTWIPGHQKERTKQAWLNNRVDELSRIARKRIRPYEFFG